MKLLNGRELAGFIKERQAKEVRRLNQAEGIQPRLAIIQMKDDPVINTYVRLKQRYGDDIGVQVDIHHPSTGEAVNLIDSLNSDRLVHGIIVQLPLSEPAHTERVINSVISDKDVDGLAKETEFDPATPTAIMWLLSGYAVDLQGKQILVIGTGPLVGGPMVRILNESGFSVTSADSRTDNIPELMSQSDVIISATGQPGLVTSQNLKHKAIVVDAGTAVAEGKTVGDIAASVYEERDDLTITPQKGGVGPLTVCSLFENVLLSARNSKS